MKSLIKDIFTKFNTFAAFSVSHNDAPHNGPNDPDPKSPGPSLVWMLSVE